MNLKTLLEQRADLQTELETILSAAKTEERALSAEETSKFDEVENSIKAIDETIDREERASKMEVKKVVEIKPEVEERAVVETRAFENYIKSQIGMPVEIRAGEQNLTMANNGAVIPTTIVNRIISTVKEMSPIFAQAERYNSKGTLKLPVYGKANTTHDIAVGYQTEFVAITADVGKFTSVDLTGFLSGALSLLGRSVINNAAVNVVDYIVKEMASKIALFLEKELINGTTDKATGAISTSTTLNAGSTSAITADNLIELQAKIPTIYQAKAGWIMAPATFTAMRKLKDGDGKYLLQNDFSQSFPYSILGKPVYLSDNMPAISSANKAVLYGDFSGLAVNMREDIEIQILMEKYADQHAIGVIAWFEFDSKVVDNQKIAALVMSTN
jgi:HK97 family phage major capsid protein